MFRKHFQNKSIQKDLQRTEKVGKATGAEALRLLNKYLGMKSRVSWANSTEHHAEMGFLHPLVFLFKQSQLTEEKQQTTLAKSIITASKDKLCAIDVETILEVIYSTNKNNPEYPDITLQFAPLLINNNFLEHVNRSLAVFRGKVGEQHFIDNIFEKLCKASVNLHSMINLWQQWPKSNLTAEKRLAIYAKYIEKNLNDTIQLRPNEVTLALFDQVLSQLPPTSDQHKRLSFKRSILVDAQDPDSKFDHIALRHSSPLQANHLHAKPASSTPTVVPRLDQPSSHQPTRK